MNYVIGCDLGSQGVKTVLLTAEGQLIAESGVSYGINYPYPTWAEQPTNLWTDALCSAIKSLITESGVTGDDITAIGLDAQVDGVVPVDKQGKPLRQAIIWMDRRAVLQCNAIGEICSSQRIFEVTGLNLDASHVAPKIRWIADVESEIYRKAEYFLLPGSYIAYYLSGELAVDYSNASSTMLMDVHSKNWSDEMCAICEISPKQLTPIYPATTDIGSLRPAIAELMGLKPSTRIILGSGDEHAACLGAGVIKPGIVCDIAGTAEPVCAASPSPLFDPIGLIETHCHADPDSWLLENPGFASGANYRWFRDEFSAFEVQSAYQSGENAYELLNQLADEIPPGSNGLIFLPCLMGALAPTWNEAARGTYFGFTLAHSRKHFVRALLEGSAYAVRDIIDQMRVMGLPLEQIRVVGGGARSRLWRQIKADVTGLQVALPHTTETTALGAGMLALVGTGLCTSLEEAANCAVHIIETLEPIAENKQRYEEYYQLYRSTYSALLPVFDQLARITVNK
ncbi:MAG: xylulokinase [Chloroflexi bacterium]|nr:xylulokinase [Chloroflexota bacterium]